MNYKEKAKAFVEKEFTFKRGQGQWFSKGGLIEFVAYVAKTIGSENSLEVFRQGVEEGRKGGSAPHN